MAEELKARAEEPMDRDQKLRKAIIDPEYRLSLLVNGDPDLNDIICNATACAEFVFRAAAAGAGKRDLSIKDARLLGDPSTWRFTS